MSVAAFTERGDLAVVLGVLCGFSEQSLGAALGRQATKLLPATT